MYNGPWGHAGKTAYLKQQFLAMRLLFLGIQESRTPETFSSAEGVLRISAGHAAGGLYGVELWANLLIPYGYIGQQALYFKRADFQVLHRDPRILLVRVDTEYVHLALLVGYAPQSGLPHDTRSAWWEQLSQIASLKGAQDHLFVFIDANADPGECDHRHVLTSGFKHTPNTDLLRPFLEQHDLCLPITSDRHQGSFDTWVSPSGLHSNCIDHVIIPCGALDSCTFSGVIHDFDLGNGCFDHHAVALQLDWQEWAPLRPLSGTLTKKNSYCRNSATRSHVHQVLHDYTPAAWQVDVEQQVDGFNQHIAKGIAQCCPSSSKKPKKSFIPDSVWHLRLCKLERRKALKELEQRRRFELLHLCFFSMIKHPEEKVIHTFWRYDTWLLCCKISSLWSTSSSHDATASTTQSGEECSFASPFS